VAYFRTKDRRLAVRDLGGGVKLLPADVLSGGADMSSVRLDLSHDGRRLAVSGPSGTRVYDTGTGARLGSLPGTESFTGFSGDGGEVLTGSDGAESTADYSVYDDSGRRLLHVTPPQLVAANGPVGLAADGRTVAVFVAAKRPSLRLFDLRGEQFTATVELPGGIVPEMVDWTGEHEVTLHVPAHSEKEGVPAGMRILVVDVTTGEIRVRDSYRVMDDSYSFAACGG
jgi:hypothetical protein